MRRQFGTPTATSWPGARRLPFFNHHFPQWPTVDAAHVLRHPLAAAPPQLRDLIAVRSASERARARAMAQPHGVALRAQRMLVPDPSKRARADECLRHAFFDDVRGAPRPCAAGVAARAQRCVRAACGPGEFSLQAVVEALRERQPRPPLSRVVQHELTSTMRAILVDWCGAARAPLARWRRKRAAGWPMW